MRTPLAVPLLALSAALAGCQVCTDPTPWPALADEPLGARCDREGQCAAGLTCLDHTCTIPCQGAPQACPSGSTCFFDLYCLPTCASAADCLLGHTVGGCAGPPATDPPYCYQQGCDADGACPQGWCAGRSLARGITWQDTCSGGYCMRDLPR